MRTAINQTKNNIRDNLFTTFSGVVTTTISLTILGAFILIYINLIHLSQIFFQQSHYSVFLSQEITEENQRKVDENLKNIWGIENIHWTTPDQAKKEILSSFTEARGILEKIEFTSLPLTVEFSLNRVTNLSSTELESLKAIEGVEEVFFGRETKDQIDTFFDIAEFVGFFLIGLLMLSIFIIIQNTIQISISVRIEEIEILKNIGATSRFIRLPYLLEGTLVAVIGYVLALGVIYFLFQFVVAGITFNEATYKIRDIVVYFRWTQQLIALAVILILGFFSSYFATNKILSKIEH